MEIVFIRHGESTANVMNRETYTMFIGQYDCHLTEAGAAKAGSLRGNPAVLGADACYCSDLLRARETAAGFAEGAVIYDRRLRERSLGEFEGKLVADVLADPKYEAYRNEGDFMAFRHDFSAKLPGGENYADVCGRVREFWQELSGRDCKKVIVVSHMCTIRCFLHVLGKLSREEAISYRVPQCEPIIITV